MLSRPKDCGKRTVIVNLSHPKGTSLNDQTDNHVYDGCDFDLKLPTIDHIVQDILITDDL